MAQRYPAPTGYAPGGVSYLPYPRRRPTTSPVATTTPSPAGHTTSILDRLRQHLAGPADPYAPLSEDEISRRVRERVTASTDPVIAEITRSINADTERRAAGMRSFTEAQAAELGKYQPVVAGIYNRGEERMSAVDSALAASQRGEGDQAAQQLSTRLASVNAPGAVGEQAGALTQAGTGAANAQYAAGSADVKALITRGTEEENLAAQYPRLARLVGMQGIRQLEQDAQTNLADQTGQIRSQVPGMVGDLEADYRTNEFTKAASREKRAQDARNYKEDVRQFNVTLAENKKIRQAQLDASTASAGAKVITDAAKATRPNSALSKVFGYVVDANGDPILRNGERVPVAKSKTDTRQKVAVALSKSYGYLVDAYGNPILQDGKRVPIKGDSTGKSDARAKALKNKSTATKTASDTAFTRAREFYKGQTVTTAGTQSTPGGKKTVRKSWADAYRAIYAEVSPQLLQRFAMKPAEVRSIVQNALIAAGYRPEGEAAPGKTTRRPDVGKPTGG